MRQRTILVHEYVTGGGFAPLPNVPSLCAEGDIMLRAVLDDFKAWGRARIVTTRDQRMKGPPLDADETVSLLPGNFSSRFYALTREADATMVIAPEEHGILAELSEKILESGGRLLGSLPQGIRLAGDKWLCHNRLQETGLPQPETTLAPPGEARRMAMDFGFPLVLKTLDGQGSLGVCLATDKATLDRALEHLPHSAPLLVQRYHDGVHASASLLVSGAGILPICANKQHITPGIPFSYHGGSTPFFRHPEIERAMSLAVKAVRAVPGLQGFVGVDMILDKGHCLLVEMNPRVTVAYAGVRKVVDCNLARAVTRACLDNELPERITVRGHLEFNPLEAGHEKAV